MIPLDITAAKRLPPEIAIMMSRNQATVPQPLKVPGGTNLVTTPT